jgi:hypothetical protein
MSIDRIGHVRYRLPKGLGIIYHQVAYDCFSFLGAASVYENETAKVSTDVVKNRLAKKSPQ